MTSEPDSDRWPPWLRGALTSGIGALIGIGALALFCYSLGLNLTDEGWGEGVDPWQTHRWELIGSLIGFAIAILVFWIGFFQTTHSRK